MFLLHGAQKPRQGRIHVPTVCQASKQGEMRRDAFTVMTRGHFTYQLLLVCRDRFRTIMKPSNIR